MYPSFIQIDMDILNLNMMLRIINIHENNLKQTSSCQILQLDRYKQNQMERNPSIRSTSLVELLEFE